MATVVNENAKTSIGNELDFDSMRNAVEHRHGVYAIFTSFCLFFIVNWIIKMCGVSKTVAGEEWKCRNLFVSWIHSSCVSVWVIACFVLYPDMWSDMRLYINYFTFTCVCFSTGYFVYDFVDLLMNHKLLPLWEVAAHHIVVVSIFCYNIYLKVCIGMSLIALLVEVNSVFLHWRKLLQMVKTPYTSLKYIVVKYLNLLTFLIFRGVPLVMISAYTYSWRNLLPKMYIATLSTIMIFMNILNSVLLWRLVRNDVLRGLKKKSAPESSASVTKDEPLIDANSEPPIDANGHTQVCDNNNSAEGARKRRNNTPVLS